VEQSAGLTRVSNGRGHRNPAPRSSNPTTIPASTAAVGPSTRVISHWAFSSASSGSLSLIARRRRSGKIVKKAGPPRGGLFAGRPNEPRRAGGLEDRGLRLVSTVPGVFATGQVVALQQSRLRVARRDSGRPRRRRGKRRRAGPADRRAWRPRAMPDRLGDLHPH
jgi:hypothetical protein